MLKFASESFSLCQSYILFVLMYLHSIYQDDTALLIRLKEMEKFTYLNLKIIITFSNQLVCSKKEKEKMISVGRKKFRVRQWEENEKKYCSLAICIFF